MKGRLSWLRDIKRVKGVYVSPPVSSPCQVYTAWVTGHWPCYSNCKKQLLAQDSHMQGREKKKKEHHLFTRRNFCFTVPTDRTKDQGLHWFSSETSLNMRLRANQGLSLSLAVLHCKPKPGISVSSRLEPSVPTFQISRDPQGSRGLPPKETNLCRIRV